VGRQVSFLVQVMIRNPILGNWLTADEAYETSPMNTKLYVGNLSFNSTEASLRAAFGQFGTITDVYLASDRETGRPRGFAFVTFGTEQESQLAAEKMNGADLDGRPLTVNEAKPKEAMGGGRNFSSPNRQAGAFQARGNSRY
jgi:RNA recognition motif-containing protein